MNTPQATLEYILKSITQNPDNVSVAAKEENSATILEISADNAIIGQIIGKQGKIIKAIRTIINLSYPALRYVIEFKE